MVLDDMGQIGDEATMIYIWNWKDEEITDYLREWAEIRKLKLPIIWKPCKSLADVWLCVNEIAYMRMHIEGRQTRDEGINFSNFMHEAHWGLWTGLEEKEAARRLACALVYSIEKAKEGIII